MTNLIGRSWVSDSALGAFHSEKQPESKLCTTQDAATTTFLQASWNSRETV